MIEQLFEDTLRKKKLRLTNERYYLFTLLSHIDGPISIKELVNKSALHLNRSTVYRTLDTFEKSAITTRVYTGWKYKVELSEMFNGHHHHMICSRCGMIIAFEESSGFLQELHKLEEKYHFKTVEHSLELKGVCNNCLLVSD